MRGGQVIGLHYSDTVPMLDIEVIQMLVQFGANTHGRIVDCTVGQKKFSELAFGRSCKELNKTITTLRVIPTMTFFAFYLRPRG